jgi:hypothetical protein
MWIWRKKEEKKEALLTTDFTDFTDLGKEEEKGITTRIHDFESE